MADQRRYADRHTAGDVLGELLARRYADRPGLLVLGLPRGGVPVAAVVAERLRAPLDVLLVRKLGYPRQPELAIGAIASGGALVRNTDLVAQLRISETELADIVARETPELRRRERSYRGDRPPLSLRDRVVILVDDGSATGASMRSAVTAARQLAAAEVVVGLPVGSESACRELADIVDAVVCVRTPEPFYAVGQWYADFRPIGDEEVIAALSKDN